MKALIPENTLKPQRNTSPTSGTDSQPAGHPDFQRDDDFCQRDAKNYSRTAISSVRTAKSLAGQRKFQQGEWRSLLVTDYFVSLTELNIEFVYIWEYFTQTGFGGYTSEFEIMREKPGLVITKYPQCEGIQTLGNIKNNIMQPVSTIIIYNRQVYKL
ncbi:MAG: hypothetical protein Q8R96_11085 [Bacteroidota bacterium]|nr:hypothetical protein [Bacteroidota bacterium]